MRAVVAEPAYEFANAFRSPKGAQHIVFQKERIAKLAHLWSREFNIERQRLLQWAAMKTGLSIAWRNGDMFEDYVELELLEMMLHMARSPQA